jgi:hypothetical protein
MAENKVYTINDAIRDKKSVSFYVVNTSDNVYENNGRPIKGDVSCPIVSDNGQTTNIRVPNTWIPIDLSLQVTKEDLVKSPRIRSMLQAGILKLLSEEEALEILDTPLAKAEVKRINKDQNERITVANFAGKLTEGERENTGLKPSEGNVNALEVDGTVIELFDNDTLTDQDIHLQLMNIKNRLSLKDWTYVIDNTKSEEIREFAIKCMEELKQK